MTTPIPRNRRLHHGDEGDAASPSHPLALVRKTELAELLGCSQWSLQRWLRAGKIPRPFYLVDGGPAHWKIRDIEAFIEQRRRSRRARPVFQGVVKQQMSSRAQTDAPVVKSKKRRREIPGARA
jgi:predicted DNA-binding transcriptional regulator AlpA